MDRSFGGCYKRMVLIYGDSILQKGFGELLNYWKNQKGSLRMADTAVYAILIKENLWLLSCGVATIKGTTNRERRHFTFVESVWDIKTTMMDNVAGTYELYSGDFPT